MNTGQKLSEMIDYKKALDVSIRVASDFRRSLSVDALSSDKDAQGMIQMIDNYISNKSMESNYISNVIDSKITENRTTCSHDEVVQIIDNSRVVYECTNCSKVSEDIPEGSRVVRVIELN